MAFWQIMTLVVGVIGLLVIILLVYFFCWYMKMKDAETKRSNDILIRRAENAECELGKIRNQKRNAEESMLRQISALLGIRDDLSRKYHDLEVKLANLNDRYVIAERLHPGLAREINEELLREKRQREIDEAKKVDRIIESVINRPVDGDIINDLNVAVSSYNRLTPEQKTYVTSDIAKLNENHKLAIELSRNLEISRQEENNKKQAKDVEDKIRAIVERISSGSAISYNILERAKALYKGLSPAAVCYFDKSVLDRLNTLWYEAKSDMNRRKQESRARRENG